MTSANTIATLLSLSILAGAGYYLYQKVNCGTTSGGYTGKYDPKTGLGRGAPGFQTNVSRIAVPAHIIARIRAGEEVSAEEITAAQAEEARRKEKEESRSTAAAGQKGKSKKAGGGGVITERQSTSNGTEQVAVNEWLPDDLVRGRGQGAGRKR